MLPASIQLLTLVSHEVKKSIQVLFKGDNFVSFSDHESSYKVKEAQLQSTSCHRKRSTQSDTALLPNNVYFQQTPPPVSVSSKSVVRTSRRRVKKVTSVIFWCASCQFRSLYMNICSTQSFCLFFRRKTWTGLWTRLSRSPGAWRGPQTTWPRDCRPIWPRLSFTGKVTTCSH